MTKPCEYCGGDHSAIRCMSPEAAAARGETPRERTGPGFVLPRHREKAGIRSKVRGLQRRMMGEAMKKKGKGKKNCTDK